jgi:hypothetical protein
MIRVHSSVRPYIGRWAWVLMKGRLAFFEGRSDTPCYDTNVVYNSAELTVDGIRFVNAGTVNSSRIHRGWVT